MQPLISVIVPIYNTEQYLHQCIDSIINQTYENLEIILIDDGATDDSGKICDEYAKKDNRITVIHQKNYGLVKSRKIGASIAKGKYISFVDSDDWLELEMYENLIKIILDSNADFIDFVYSKIDKNTNNPCKIPPNRTSSDTIIINDSIRKELIRKFLLINNQSSNIWVPLWSKLIKKDLLKKAQLLIDDKLTYGEDTICDLYLIQYANKIVYTNKCYYNYRVREDSMTHKKNIANNIPQIIIMLKEIYKFLDYFKYDISYKQAALYRILPYLLVFSNNEQKNINKIYSLYKYNDIRILNKNIVLYGAGDIGISYYNYHKNNMNIVCWADKNYQHLTDYPVKIESPDNILNYNFDYLLIAVKSENLANLIKQDLIFKGIPEEKILWSKPESTLDWLL